MLCTEGKSLQVEAMLVVCLVRVYCSLMSDVTKLPEDSPQLVVLTSEQCWLLGDYRRQQSRFIGFIAECRYHLPA